MKLEALPAAKGDCLLLHHGTPQKPKLVLIDGGPAGIYQQSLKPRLLALRQERIAAGLLRDDQKLFIDLLIVSHIDDDHINGVIALLEDMADRSNPAPFRIGRLWHNSFDSLVGTGSGKVAEASVHGDVVTAAVGAELVDGDGEEHDVAMVLASVGQGYQLLGLAKKLSIGINSDFSGLAIEASDGKKRDVDGLKVTVLGPMHDELANLRADFAKWLEARKKGGGTTASLIASFTDLSVPNLSSIVLLVEGEGQKYLLTGDARADKVRDAAKKFNLLNAKGELPVDLFKVPHHGSDRNNGIESFKAFPAPCYVFSGNGEHGNPERKTLSDLAAARAGVTLDIRLTYSPAEIDKGRKSDWAKHNKAKPFDEATQGIVPFLAAHPELVVSFPG